MNYKMTSLACFTGYIVQAIVVNFVPLLFVMMQTDYGITLGQITSMITVNFVIQLLTDMSSAGFVDKIGYRAAAIAAHIFAVFGIKNRKILTLLWAAISRKPAMAFQGIELYSILNSSDYLF